MKHLSFLGKGFVILLFLSICKTGCYAITRAKTYDGSTLSVSNNTESTVSSISSTLTLTTPIDLIITGDAPTVTASINISNNSAVVIFRDVKPTDVINKYLSRITVNGETATNGTNCRVEIYRHGSIVLPYGNSCNPLTVYSGTALSGDAKSDFEINTYYKNLKSWDNTIQSFTLKRGYMVTMANHSDGTGYSHCFIANDGDITVTLPKDMRRSVSFLRIFTWRWPSKKGYAGLSETPMSLMNVTWFYNWNSESYSYKNYDYVPQRHHETGYTSSNVYKWRWPEWSDINNKTSAHVLGTNEPDNTGGSEVYMAVSALITHHKEYLESGMRIGTFACCNPNTSWVSDYVSQCEALNYRVDFVATHYYIGGQSPASCINSLKALYDATNLPVWVTEWNNGANWTSETGFTTDSLGYYTWGEGNDFIHNGTWLKDVLKRADQTTWLERLAVYNNVEQKRYVHWISDDYWTTDAGNIYGAYRSDFAYDATTDVWMNWQDQGSPTGLSGGTTTDGNIQLIWTNPNGDWVKDIYIQEKQSNGNWNSIYTVPDIIDSNSRTAEFASSLSTGQKIFRIKNSNPDGTIQYSEEFTLDTTLPNGLLKLTSIPSNYEDYYYQFYSSDATTDLCWTLANANLSADYTNYVGTAKTNWTGASGTTTGNGISLVELYNSSSAGTKMYQDVSGLPAGKYKVVLYATSHNARGENGATLNGTRDDLAYVFATSGGVTQKTYFTASGITPGFLDGEPFECTISDINVSSGTLRLGLGLEESNITGWHTIQIKSLTRTGDTDDHTGAFGTSKSDWTGASGTTTGNGISLVELYNSSSAGTKMYQTVTSLPSGYYDAVIYATSHNARGENGATLNGTSNDVAYVYATSGDVTKKTYFTASGVTPGFLAEEPHECTISNIKVEDGTLTLGLGLDESNITGWHTIQLKKLTRTGDISGVESVLTTGKAIHYATPVTLGTSLAQIWQLEANDNGYALRCPSYYNFVLCGSIAQSNGSTHYAGTSCYLPVYDSSSGSWRMEFVTDESYLGMDGATPVNGDEVCGGCTYSNADKLNIFAIRKVDFNQMWMVEQGNSSAQYLIRNPDFSWGTYESAAQGSNHNYVPNEWSFNKTFSGWNDTNVQSRTINETSTNVVNVWAGSFTYAELYQTISNLPNGVYKLSAYASTTDGYSRTQSVTSIYGNAGSGNISRSYNITGSGDDNFTKYECYILVTDAANNAMTIGARSDGTWFKIGNFQLEYICAENEATEEILGYLDNGRALQQTWAKRNDTYLDLSSYTNCRMLQIDMNQANAIVKVADENNYDNTYNRQNILIGSTCPNLVITDKEDYGAPNSFTATKANYSRTNTAGYNTFCLPFNVSANDFPSGSKLYEFTGVETANTLPCLTFCETTSDIPAGTPILIFCSEDVTSWELSELGSRTAGTTAGSVTTNNNSSILNGSFTAKTLGEGFYKLNSSGTYFVKTTESSTVKPFRFYLQDNENISNVRGEAFLQLVHEDGTTQIVNVPSSKQSTFTMLYGLSGRRIPNDLKLQKGIYITHGKKIAR